MTTIVVRDGVMAADSRVTVETDAGGSRVFRCEKLYRVSGGIVGLAGGAFDGLVFLDWLKDPKDSKPPDRLIAGDADFTAIYLTNTGLYEYDRWCRPEKVLEKFYAVGSGAKAALGALHMGASAVEAVKVACKVDPYSATPIKFLTLQPRGKRK